MIYTIYHAPEDAHLVGPLARFIELTEVDLVCVDSEPARYVNAGLVMCGRGYESQPWLKKALRSSTSLIAVLLADVDPGVKNAQRVDLRAWPGRSADRTVLALAEWLKSDGKSVFPGMSAQAARTAASPQRSQNIAAFVVLSVIVGLFFMMARLTDPKSDTLTPLGAPPPAEPVSSTTNPASSATVSAQLSGSGTVSPASKTTVDSASDDHHPKRPDSTSQTMAAGSDAARINASTVSGKVSKKVSEKVPEEMPEKKPETTRAALDRCFLQRRANADVPPRTCLLSIAIRRPDTQQLEELL